MSSVASYFMSILIVFAVFEVLAGFARWKVLSELGYSKPIIGCIPLVGGICVSGFVCTDTVRLLGCIPVSAKLFKKWKILTDIVSFLFVYLTLIVYYIINGAESREGAIKLLYALLLINFIVRSLFAGWQYTRIYYLLTNRVSVLLGHAASLFPVVAFLIMLQSKTTPKECNLWGGTP